MAYAADGTSDDPGPRCVFADELGVLLDLASPLRFRLAPIADARVIDRAARRGPWVLPTLDALAGHGSVRLAANALFVHHSTLQARIALLEKDLKWSVVSPLGRHRLFSALHVRRFLLHPPPLSTVAADATGTAAGRPSNPRPESGHLPFPGPR